jgi:polyhydroxyalkanoate synthesis regulator phasin
MSDIKTLIDYLNPKKGDAFSNLKEEYHLICIDNVFVSENQNIDSENITRVIKKELPKPYVFNDDFVKISTSYPLFLSVNEGVVHYFFQRNQGGIYTYVSLEDLLLRDTNESHFHEIDDSNFIECDLQYIHYYHKSQKKIYSVEIALPEVVITAKKTLSYNPNELGGLKSGSHEMDFQDATGHQNNFWSLWAKDLFDGGTTIKDLNKYNVQLFLNPQIGKVHWYPEVTLQEQKVVLYYDYSRQNEDFNPLDHEYAIKLEFEDPEGFLAFMILVYFSNGISPLQVTGDTDSRKKQCFVNYVKIINMLLKGYETDIDKALTYLYYIPADFFVKSQNLTSKKDNPDNILGAQFVWDVIGIALEDYLTNFGTNREDIVLRLLKILKYIQKDKEATVKEKNDYLLNQLLSRKTSDKVCYLEALYKKLNTKSFVIYNDYLYRIWLNSSFVNPASPIFKATSPLSSQNEDGTIDKNKPRLVFPYKTNKLLGFYSSNINISDFNDKGNIIVTPNESWVNELATAFIGKGMGEFIKQFVEEDWQAEYHPLQPVYLADPYKDKAIQLQKIAPMLLLKANEDKSFWENIITATEYGIDVLTTLSGVGNILKFRHLARAVQVARSINTGKKVIWYYKASRVIKGAAGTVEITSGTINALLKITGIKDEAFGAALSEYLFWLELLTLSGELTLVIKKGLQNSAKKLVDKESIKHLEQGLDDLVKRGEVDKVAKRKVVDELSFMAKPQETGKLGGKVLKNKQVRKLRGDLKKHGGLLILEEDLLNKSIINQFKPIYIGGVKFENARDLFYFMKREGFAGAYDARTKQMVLSEKSTELVAFHEKAHLQHFEELGDAYYDLETWQKETYVWNQIWSRKRYWTKKELQTSLNYVNRERIKAGIRPLNIKL